MPVTFQHMHDVQKTCGQCSLQRLCLPYGLDNADVAKLETLVDADRSVARGSTIFAQGDSLTAIYAVATGWSRRS